jgi:murein DD-endopeptidase MepM/ murein hydrolase activator NlpD
VVGDYYIVVESGSINKWTTLYGHLQKPPSYPLFGIGNTSLNIAIKKGDQIGVLYNFTEASDIPHLHIGIRKGAYDGTGIANMGYVCATDTTYKNNKYNYVSPEINTYYTLYY